MELMKELERHADEARRELISMEGAFTSAVRKRRKITPAIEEMREGVNRCRKQAMLKQSEKVVISKSLLVLLDKVIGKLDNDIAVFESHLADSGCFDSLGAEINSEVAVHPSNAIGDGSEWILGRVLRFYRDTGYYDILDMDGTRKYFLPESEVVVLQEDGGGTKFARGEEVLAVYPDTTSFYPAQVAQAKKGVVGVHVQFDGDDVDGFGQVPVRIIPVKYVIRMQTAPV